MIDRNKQIRQNGDIMKRGFTILEVIIASALMIFALTALVSTFIISKKSAVIADNRMEALHYTRMFAETLTSKIYLDTTWLSIGAHTNAICYTNESFTNLIYRISYSVVQNTGDFATSKNIFITNKWVSPVGAYGTASVVICTSMSRELHP